MFDVGGQKNERRKWMHCFDNVSLIIFVVALDQYDQVMYEDLSKNRMSDALELFRSVALNKFFRGEGHCTIPKQKGSVSGENQDKISDSMSGVQRLQGWQL